jgi:hypothetical protein
MQSFLRYFFISATRKKIEVYVCQIARSVEVKSKEIIAQNVVRRYHPIARSQRSN